MSQVCTQNFLLSLRPLKGLNYGKKGEGFGKGFLKTKADVCTQYFFEEKTREKVFGLLGYYS